MLSLKNIGVLIIFFNPTQEDIFNAKRNISLFRSGILVWNSKKIFRLKNPNFFEIELKENLGQAKALNIGFKEAINMKIDLLLTLDQDSKLIENELNLLEIINSHYYKCFNPAGFSFLISNKPKHKKKDHKDFSPYLTLTPIISGTIYLTSVWEKLNGFKNELFIEGIDTEYSIRARKNKFYFFKFDYPIMVHDAGVPIIKTFLNFNFIIRRHSDIRLYLQYRNNLPIFLKNSIHFPKWALISIFNLLTKKILISALGSKNILRTFLWIARGLLNGLLESTPFKVRLQTPEFMLKNYDNDK